MTWLAAALLCLAGASPTGPTIDSARALITGGRVVEALKQIQQLQKAAPNDPDLQFQIGELLQELAASRAEKLRTLAPDSAQAHELLGKSLESHQKMAEAEVEYKLAIKAGPTMPGIHFLLGNLYYKQRKPDEALSSLQSELSLNPHHAFANLRVGQILLSAEADTPQKAIPFLRAAVADPHTGIEAHRELGKALRMSGSYSEALRELLLVAKQKPDDESVHAQLAALYRAQGNLQSARSELELQRKLLQNKHEASLQAHRPESGKP